MFLLFLKTETRKRKQFSELKQSSSSPYLIYIYTLYKSLLWSGTKIICIFYCSICTQLTQNRLTANQLIYVFFWLNIYIFTCKFWFDISLCNFITQTIHNFLLLVVFSIFWFRITVIYIQMHYHYLHVNSYLININIITLNFIISKTESSSTNCHATYTMFSNPNVKIKNRS